VAFTPLRRQINRKEKREVKPKKFIAGEVT